MNLMNHCQIGLGRIDAPYNNVFNSGVLTALLVWLRQSTHLVQMPVNTTLGLYIQMKGKYWLSVALILAGAAFLNVNVLAGYMVLLLGGFIRGSLNNRLNIGLGIKIVRWYHYPIAIYLALLCVSSLYFGLSGSWQHNGIPAARELMPWISPLLVVAVYEEYKFYKHHIRTQAVPLNRV